MYIYSIWVAIFGIVWLALFLIRKDLKKEILYGSLVAMPFGISDIIFIPYYWNPKTLFNFVPGIESFVFAFFLGGTAGVLYEVFAKNYLVKKRERREVKFSHYFWLISIGLLSLIFLSIVFRMDLIYTSIVSMFIGATVIWISRKDLVGESLIGGVLFLIVYFLSLRIIDFAFSDWIINTWNLSVLRLPFVLGVPLEEILWALVFGMLWAPLYEDLRGYKLKK